MFGAVFWPNNRLNYSDSCRRDIINIDQIAAGAPLAPGVRFSPFASTQYRDGLARVGANANARVLRSNPGCRGARTGLIPKVLDIMPRMLRPGIMSAGAKQEHRSIPTLEPPLSPAGEIPRLASGRAGHRRDRSRERGLHAPAHSSVRGAARTSAPTLWSSPVHVVSVAMAQEGKDRDNRARYGAK